VGRKYVQVICTQGEREAVRQRIEDGGVDMGNTSALDIGVLADGCSEEEKREAQERFPLFREAEFVDCILEEESVCYNLWAGGTYVRA